MKIIKIYLNENDAEDIASELKKGNEGLYDTHIVQTDFDQKIGIEIHIKNVGL